MSPRIGRKVGPPLEVHRNSARTCGIIYRKEIEMSAPLLLPLNIRKHWRYAHGSEKSNTLREWYRHNPQGNPTLPTPKKR